MDIKPLYLESEMNVFVDCDDTLVMWNKNPDETDVVVKDPYKKDEWHALKKHKRHIDLIKDYKARGYTVVVWSAAGAPWAKAVVDALKIEEYVSVIMSKPIKYVDDLQAEEIMGSRIYIKEA